MIWVLRFANEGFGGVLRLTFDYKNGSCVNTQLPLYDLK